jgi:hypothetical protein
MPYRDLDPTPAEKTAITNAPESEVETPPRRTAPDSRLWAGLGGPPADAGEALRKSTNGKMSRAGNVLLQLQNQYGNHHVQQVVNQVWAIQKKESNGPDTLQHQPSQPTNAGLPDQLKTNLEQMSGLDMSDVRVHRHSARPAQVQAAAYTRGSDIYLDSGQERHLPHEAWHVVQQKQGRVQPTMQAGGAAINDDPGLEYEADRMGKAAVKGQMRKNQVPGQSQAGQVSPDGAGDGSNAQVKTYHKLQHYGGVIQGRWLKHVPRFAIDRWHERIDGRQWYRAWDTNKWEMVYWHESSGKSSGKATKKSWKNLGDPDIDKAMSILAPRRPRAPQPPQVEEEAQQPQAQPQVQPQSKQERKRQWVAKAQQNTVRKRAALRELDNLDYRTFISSPAEQKGFLDLEMGNAEGTANQVKEAIKSKELDYLSKIPIEDLTAISAYQGADYTRMNADLRGNRKVQPNLLAASGLNQLPPVYGTVYRGVKFNVGEAQHYRYLDVGQTITEKAFVSVTVDKRYWPKSQFGDGVVAFQIESRGGAKDMRSFAGAGIETEDELIFTPGTRFKVDGITPWPQEITSDNAEKIPKRPTETSPIPLQELQQNYKAVAIYLEEKPSHRQKQKYRELDRQHGTVNITRATAISNLLRPVWANLAQGVVVPTGLQEKYFVHVLSAVKLISRDEKLSNQVIQALKFGGVSNLSKLASTSPIVRTFVVRWDDFVGELQSYVAKKIQEKAKEVQEKKKADLAKQEKEDLLQIILNDQRFVRAMQAWWAENSGVKMGERYKKIRELTEKDYGPIKGKILNQILRGLNMW